MACLRAAAPHSCGNDPPGKRATAPESLQLGDEERSTTRAGKLGARVRGWGGRKGNWSGNLCELWAGRGPRGRREKRPGVKPGKGLPGPGTGVRGAVERGQREGRTPGRCAQIPPNPGGGWGGGGLWAPGPPVARGPLTCQQEGASGRGAHPACPPTLSRPSTRVSQLPPPGQLHSWPG